MAPDRCVELAADPSSATGRLSHRSIFCLHDRQKKWNRAIIQSRELGRRKEFGRGRQSGASSYRVMHAVIPIA
jgi:hypothetical protein